MKISNSFKSLKITGSNFFSSLNAKLHSSINSFNLNKVFNKSHFSSKSSDSLEGKLESAPAQAEMDLDLLRQDFVLETKQILIPNHPHAFNPSMIRWNDRILLSFRELDEKQKSSLGLVWVDEEMNLISPVQILHSNIDSGFEDVRLVSVKDKLYIVYSGTPSLFVKNESDPQKITGSSGNNVRIRTAELLYNDEFSIQNDECFLLFENADPNKPEKNWVPFEYNGELVFSYSLSPHKVLRPIWGTQTCETLCLDNNKIDTHLGDLRGGTPTLLLENGKILSFFHTQKHMISKHSLGKTTPHYFMGAYLYSPDIPMTITHITPEPIVGTEFYNGKFYTPHWHNVNVVFPGGFILQKSDEKQYALLAYGRQDHEIWTAKIDVDELLESLRPAETTAFSLPNDFCLTQFFKNTVSQELKETYEEKENRLYTNIV